MRLRLLLIGSLAGVASVASQHNPQVEFAAQEAPSFRKLGQYAPKASFSQNPSDKTQILHDLHAFHAQSLNEIDYTDMRLSKSASANLDKKQPKSPAMSALTLMGFLYFLNLIQDVLQGKTGRKKREVRTAESNEKEGSQDFFFALEDLAQRVTDAIPPSGSEGRAFKELIDYLKFSPENSVEVRTMGIFSYMSSFMNKIMKAIGLGKDATSRHDQNVVEAAGPGLWSIFGERIGLVARIMDFLDDPSPSRIGRSYRELDQSETNPDEEYAEAENLSEEDKSFLPASTSVEGRSQSRKKRFSVDDMNIWYSEAYESPSEEPAQEGRHQKLIGMILNLLGGIRPS